MDNKKSSHLVSSILKDKGFSKTVLILRQIPETNLDILPKIRQKLGTLGNLALDVIEHKRSVPGLERVL